MSNEKSNSVETAEAKPGCAPATGSALRFQDLRDANAKRQREWCPDVTPDLSFRGNELAGETGEACNVIKKLERERQGWRGSRATREQLAEELADVIIVADLIALDLGIDLGEAVRAKFDATSAKYGLSVKIAPKRGSQRWRWEKAMSGEPTFEFAEKVERTAEAPFAALTGSAPVGKPYLVPMTLRKANDFVAAHHRHNGRTARNGGKWACGLACDERLVGVAIVGNPLSATLMDGWTAEVLRVCTVAESPKGACSMLYQACWRAWRAMGGRRLITYTLESESGASLRGAGWRVVGETKPVKDGWRKNDHLNGTRTHSPVMLEVKNRWQMDAGTRNGEAQNAAMSEGAGK